MAEKYWNVGFEIRHHRMSSLLTKPPAAGKRHFMATDAKNICGEIFHLSLGALTRAHSRIGDRRSAALQAREVVQDVHLAAA